MANISCCLPAAVEARTVAVNDRRAFATRSIQAGEAVLRNAPLAHVSHVSDRCAFCLQNPPKLARCGRCKDIYYCGRTCQRQDYTCHKIECGQALSDDAALLVRTFVRIQRMDNQCGMKGKDNVAHCGVDHFHALALWTHTLDVQDGMAIDTATSAIIARFKDQSRDNVRAQLERYLRIFRVNNFGVVDSLLRIIAGGVYPLGALLNHSCQPNCVLRYILLENNSPIMEIAACRDISQNEELTHSYVELVAPTPTRQSRLQDIHGFTCTCPRCCGNCTVELPRDYQRRENLTTWLLQRYNPYLSHTDDDIVEIEMDVAMTPAQDSSLVTGAENLRQQAKQHMTNDHVEGELQCLEEAVCILSKDNPLSIYLYQARGDLLGTFVVAGMNEQALHQCEHVVAFLCIALQHAPSHPLLGLQLFTLGDLYEASGMEEQAQATYQWARKTLAISQGTDSDMVQLLNDKIR